VLLHQAGRNDQPLELIRRSVELNGSRPNVHSNLASVLGRTGPRHSRVAAAPLTPGDAFRAAMLGPLPNTDASGKSVVLITNNNVLHRYIVAGNVFAAEGPQQVLYEVDGLSSASIWAKP
jgi:hypothetical protein